MLQITSSKTWKAKILINPVSDQRTVPRIYEEHLHITKRQITQLKMGKRFELIVFQEGTGTSNKHIKDAQPY